MVIIGPSFLKLNSDDFPFFKTFLAPIEAEIGFWKNIRFFCESDSLGLVYPNSTQTFEDLYSLTKLEKVTSSFIRGLYFHKMGTMTGMFSFFEGFLLSHPKKRVGHIYSNVFYIYQHRIDIKLSSFQSML